MKKVFCFLIAFLSITIVSQAQICRINGTDDTVEVQHCSYNPVNGNIEVTVGNDSQNTAANVTVKVEVEYQRYSTGITEKKTYTGKDTAIPNRRTFITIDPHFTHDYKVIDVKCTDISGTKCMQ